MSYSGTETAKSVLLVTESLFKVILAKGLSQQVWAKIISDSMKTGALQPKSDTRPTPALENDEGQTVLLCLSLCPLSVDQLS